MKFSFFLYFLYAVYRNYIERIPSLYFICFVLLSTQCFCCSTKWKKEKQKFYLPTVILSFSFRSFYDIGRTFHPFWYIQFKPFSYNKMKMGKMVWKVMNKKKNKKLKNIVYVNRGTYRYNMKKKLYQNLQCFPSKM